MTGAIISFVLLFISIIPVALPMSALPAVLLTAPSMLIMPTAFGLFLLQGLSNLHFERLAKIQTLLIAYFFGLFVLILTFVASERFLGKFSQPDLIICSIWFVSLFGLLRARNFFAFSRDAGQQMLVFAAVFGLLVGVRYSYSVLIFSDYPVTDLFQRVQFHGGAWEFARNSALNPFVAASYIPFQQLQLGLLLRLTGADPLVAEWVWPITMAPLQAAAIYTFFSQLIPQRRAGILASALALSQLDLSNPTNGTLAELASITLLSLVLSCDYGKKRGGELIICLVAVVAGSLLGFALNRVPLEIVIVLTAGLLILSRVAAANVLQGLFAPVLILSAVTIPFHRGALLYVALGSFAATVYKYLVSVRALSQRQVRQVMRVFLVVIVAVAAAMVLIILSPAGVAQGDTFGLFWIFDIFLIPLAGKSLALVAGDGDLAPGVGARVALFELGRAVSPLIMCIITFYSVLQSIRAFRDVWFFSREGTDRHILAQVLVVFGLIVLILTGFPFIHRAAFLVTLFASAASANIFLCIRFDRTKAAITSAITLTYAATIIGSVYLIAPSNVYLFLERALPVFAMLGASLAMSLLIPAKTLAAWRWKVGLILILSVSAEVALVTTYFKPYAFDKQTPPRATPFSSFDKRDLALAHFINKHSSQSQVIVSDPKTMTFIRARTGRYPLLSTSNLDTLSPVSRSKLVSLLSGTINQQDNTTCTGLMALLNTGASAIYNYGHVRQQSSNGKSVLAALGYDNKLVPTYNPNVTASLTDVPEMRVGDRAMRKFLIVFAQQTMEWLSNPEILHYFPEHEPLSQATLDKLVKKFPDHQVFDNTFIAELTCG